MKRVLAFSDLDEAIHSLNNGGRFFSLLDKSVDGTISSSEIAKLTGWCLGNQKRVLQLALAISQLSEGERDQIWSLLDPDMLSIFQCYKPLDLDGINWAKNEVQSRNAIMSGVPRKVCTHADFEGYIETNVIVGGLNAPLMIPMNELYDIYEIKGDKRTPVFIGAHPKASLRLNEKPTKLGGILKQFYQDRDKKKAPELFLEIVYWVA